MAGGSMNEVQGLRTIDWGKTRAKTAMASALTMLALDSP
jgi:hypothetical protein